MWGPRRRCVAGGREAGSTAASP
uniref:Uncharacterized protein n=1 Tax=Arundo donax TaxID=35708 RepID=A0A0A9B9Q5_ARUDO